MDIKKGDKVILKGFTGIKLGVFEVVAATKKTATINKRNGDEMVFDKATGKQINVEEGKEKYANSIMEDDGSYVAPATRGASKKKEMKKPVKKAKVEEPEEDDEDDEDEEEAPAPKKSTKKPAKAAKAAKKSKKPVEVEDEEEEEEDEDEFEEID